jgi:hypothetical protein
MGTPVEKFIREAHRQYQVKYALTNEQLRRIRTKLKLAEIHTEVDEADVPMALDIILADYGMSNSTMRTASATSPAMRSANPAIRSAGVCPRCSQSMQFAKLAESEEVRYCSNCHVCVMV